MSATFNQDADYPLRAKTKAVVFTHINLKAEHIQQRGFEAHVADYVPLFERYLQCRNVGLVYMYLSLGAEEIMSAIAENKPLVIPPEVLTDEAICSDILELAEDRAREAYPNKLLRFVCVTTFQLVALLKNLYEIDPGLIQFLRRKGNVFAYDSDKFVEAAIRIARGQDPRLAFYPVVRFDEDVQVCERSLDALLFAYERFLDTAGRNPYFFFSGSYGDPDAPDKLDPINDRAVRSHWFVDKQFRPEPDKINLFWRDLGEIGATQLGVKDSPTNHGQSLIAGRGFTANRNTPQVISGAGLIMSLTAIRDLPPFMNMNQAIMWIDDHLKRQLHEMIGDIHSSELESVAEARFKQDRCRTDRPPYGITQKDIDWTASDGGYFDQLLAGCMMDALISQPGVGNDGFTRQPTEFAQAIRDIIAIPTMADKISFEQMKPNLQAYAERRYDDVLSLWQTPEFKGTVLYGWAFDKAQDTTHKADCVQRILEDAFAYLELVKRWKVSFATAIGRLKPIGNLWLFERVR